MISKKDYLLVAAIDFGTTFSGYAFSSKHDFEKDPTKASLRRWVDPTSSMMYCKTSTCILFTEDQKFDKFGFEAEAKYLDLISDDNQKNWYFFTKFKMSLYEIQSEDQEPFIKDKTGKAMPALLVFSESLGYLKQSLLNEVKNQLINIEMNEIKWVITVPAIWSDPAKAFMRRAAAKAGIDSEMLTLALEPEAAALYVKYIPVEKRVDKSNEGVLEVFRPGTKYIIVDAGGGTIDITAHEVLEDGHVKEIIKATGCNWGGTRVDLEYMDFIKSIIGKDTTKHIEESKPDVFFETCREFEDAKRRIKPNSDITFTVRIPCSIGKEYKQVNGGTSLRSIETFLTRSGKEIGISFTKDKLRLASTDAEEFFKQSITEICNYLTKLFQNKDGKGISIIILVGGYAESPMLIEGIKSNFPEMRTIIPQEASSSILLGALIFGHNPSLIKQRRSKYTYGICVNKRFNPSEHDEKHKYEEDGEERCGKFFSKLVEIDDCVAVWESHVTKRYRIKNCKDEGNLKIYASTSKFPKYVDEEECFFIGYILSPGHEFVPEEYIFINVFFGDTQIFFSADQPKSEKTAVYYLGQ